MLYKNELAGCQISTALKNKRGGGEEKKGGIK